MAKDVPEIETTNRGFEKLGVWFIGKCDSFSHFDVCYNF